MSRVAQQMNACGPGIFINGPRRTVQALVILRGLMGVGLGGAPVAFALYLELVPSAHRGVLMVALQGFWTVGSMLEVCLTLPKPHHLLHSCASSTSKDQRARRPAGLLGCWQHAGGVTHLSLNPGASLTPRTYALTDQGLMMRSIKLQKALNIACCYLKDY